MAKDWRSMMPVGEAARLLGLSEDELRTELGGSMHLVFRAHTGREAPMTTEYVPRSAVLAILRRRAE